jgi:hypothetical protein
MNTATQKVEVKHLTSEEAKNSAHFKVGAVITHVMCCFNTSPGAVITHSPCSTAILKQLMCIGLVPSLCSICSVLQLRMCQVAVVTLRYIVV